MKCAGAVRTSEDAGAVEFIHGGTVAVRHMDVRNRFVGNGVHFTQNFVGQGCGQKHGELCSGNGVAVIVERVLHDAIFQAVISIYLPPGIALNEIGGAGFIDAVQAGGQLHSFGCSHAGVGGKAAGTGAAEQAQLITGFHVSGIPAGNIAERSVRVSADGFEMVQAPHCPGVCSKRTGQCSSSEKRRAFF